MYQLGVDIGGTFTDFILYGNGKVRTLKIPSNEENPIDAILEGLNELSLQCNSTLEEFLSNITRFSHGNTVAINGLIQKKGVKTALITTKGFRDALEIRRSQLDNQWDFFTPIPEVLVPRNLRFEVTERVDYNGKVLKDLSYEDLDLIIEKIKEHDVKAVAVSLLFSFVNPMHEIKVKEYLTKRLPEVFVTLSSEVSPKLGEYERTSTTVLNAYITPLVSKYLDELSRVLIDKGLKCKIKLVQNNGGLVDLSKAKEFGVKSLFSGPAAGSSGANSLGKEIKEPNIILVDMGGTSFDVSIVEDNKVKIIPESKVEGYPVNLPLVDIHSIGIGGGSIAYLDESKSLNVGPISQEAYPGPACYNRGGTEPTITDALMVLGFIQEENFGAGSIDARKELAEEVIKEKISNPLNISVEEGAYAIYQIALQKMVDAVHLMTVQKGSDPRDFALCAVGGAAPAFAAKIADELRIKTIIVPAYGEVFCAQGMLEAQTKVDLTKSYIQPFIKENIPQINKILSELKSKGLEDMISQGVDINKISFTFYFELRYEDQHHQLSLDYYDDELNLTKLEEIISRFHKLHDETYGYKEEGEALTLVHIRLELIENRFEDKVFYEQLLSDKTKKIKERIVLCDSSIKKSKVPVYKDESITVDECVLGPALIEKDFTTIFVPQGFKAKVDSSKNVILS